MARWAYGHRVGVPLLRNGNWVAGLVVNHHEPRNWTAAEVNLVQTVAERTWLAVENRRLFQQVHRQQELLQTIFDTIPVMITRYRPDTSVLQLNRAFTQLTGWTTEAAQQIDLMAACYPDPHYREEMRACT